MIGLYEVPEALALLSACKGSPEDDGARLVLADWLEDKGDAARAEFIRLQLRLAPGGRHDPQEAARAEALLSRDGGGWLGALWRCWLHPARWHRGLLAAGLLRGVKGEAAAALAWADTLALRVTGRRSLARALALVGLARPNHLWLELRKPPPPAALLEALLAAPGLEQLRTLSLAWPVGPQAQAPDVSPDFLKRLLTAPPCRRLTHLASSPGWLPEQEALIRAQGAEPSLATGPLWPHGLPPALFKARRPS